VGRSLSLLLTVTSISTGYLVFSLVMGLISSVITTSVGSFVKQVSRSVGHIVRYIRRSLQGCSSATLSLRLNISTLH